LCENPLGMSELCTVDRSKKVLTTSRQPVDAKSFTNAVLVLLVTLLNAIFSTVYYFLISKVSHLVYALSFFTPKLDSSTTNAFCLQQYLLRMNDLYVAQRSFLNSAVNQ